MAEVEAVPPTRGRMLLFSLAAAADFPFAFDWFSAPLSSER